MSAKGGFRVRGGIIEEMVKTKWFFFNPQTKTHCVSNCLAVYKLWESTEDFHSAWGYIKQCGDYLARKYNITEGATMEELRKITEELGITVLKHDSKDVLLDEDKPFFLIKDSHCMVCLPPDERSQKIHEFTKQFTKRN